MTTLDDIEALLATESEMIVMPRECADQLLAVVRAAQEEHYLSPFVDDRCACGLPASCSTLAALDALEEA